MLDNRAVIGRHVYVCVYVYVHSYRSPHESPRVSEREPVFTLMRDGLFTAVSLFAFDLTPSRASAIREFAFHAIPRAQTVIIKKDIAGELVCVIAGIIASAYRRSFRNEKTTHCNIRDDE